MSRRRYVPRPLSFEVAVPFGCAVEAWFWAALACRARHEGARDGGAVGSVARPCEPEDVLRAAEGLWRQGRITRRQLEVMALYGRDLLPPDPLSAEQRADARLWDDALGRLEPVLRAKGIVA